MSGRRHSEVVDSYGSVERYRAELEKGNAKPSLAVFPDNHELRELLQKCFDQPEKRPTFADIVQRIEKQNRMFPGALLSKFQAYRKYLDGAAPAPTDDNPMYMLRQLRDVRQVANEVALLPQAAPFIEKIRVCFTRMFGAENADAVTLVLRHQFATRRCLEGHSFLDGLHAFERLPAGRPRFPLAEFLIDPNAPMGHDIVQDEIRIETRDDLFRALKQILVGICCSHPFVVKFHGWNIGRVDGKLKVLIRRDRAEPLLSDAVPQLLKWDVEQQRAFLRSAGAGLAALHDRGIFHDNLLDEVSVCVRYEGGLPLAQIWNVGLGAGDAPDGRFAKDTTDFSNRFLDYDPDEALIPALASLQGGLDENNIHLDPHSFETFWRVDCLPVPVPDRDAVAQRAFSDARYGDFPLDILFHLLESPNLWLSTGAGMGDIGSELALLTRGLDPAGIDTFKRAVTACLEKHGFLVPDFFGEFPRWELRQCTGDDRLPSAPPPS
jgi:hypothetical protein